MAPSSNTDAPQISFTNWILGGPLVSHPSSISGHRQSFGSQAANTSKASNSQTIKTSNGKAAATNGTEVLGLEGLGSLELIMEEDSVVKQAKESEEEKTYEKNDDGGGWTTMQDETIQTMKADSKGWKEISATVGASKKDVKARWKELSAKKGISDSEESGGGSDSKKDKNKNEKNDKGKAKEVKDEDKDKGDKVKKEDKDKDAVSKPNQRLSGRLKADTVWTREDCELLEMLEARYTEQKWMQLQAGFYNMTGRMIVAGMIERKFSDG